MLDHTNSAKPQRRYALGIEYDGSRFHGWQVQSGVRSVQESLESALSTVAAEPVRVITAGRTDTGVHATGQVVHFDSTAHRSPGAWLRGANTSSPAGIAVNWVRPVSAEFHARFGATSRAYRYVIFCRPVRPTFLEGKVTWTYRHLDVDRMVEAASVLKGRHDFSAYRASRCQSRQPVREIQALTIAGSGPWVWIDIDADGFLHHMVRNIAGVLMAIGAKDKPVDWAAKVLSSRDRRTGGVTAPPDGLYLTRVVYPERFHLPVASPPCRFW